MNEQPACQLQCPMDMKIRLALFAIFIILGNGTGSALGAAVPTQMRAENETFEQALKRYRLKAHESSRSALEAAVPIDEADFTSVTHWTSSELKTVFRQVRDDRFLMAPERPNFPRRASWLYPDDGCFARAAVTGQRLGQEGFDRPSKLFIFGQLRVQTPNGPTGRGGYVYWWYHVVSAVSEAGRIYVLDPAIFPGSAMLLNDWVRTLVDDPRTVTVSVCDHYAYEPGSSCLHSGPEDEVQAMEQQNYFLTAEWSRLVSLGRDPELELGSSPPW